MSTTTDCRRRRRSPGFRDSNEWLSGFCAESLAELNGELIKTRLNISRNGAMPAMWDIARGKVRIGVWVGSRKTLLLWFVGENDLPISSAF